MLHEGKPHKVEEGVCCAEKGSSGVHLLIAMFAPKACATSQNLMKPPDLVVLQSSFKNTILGLVESSVMGGSHESILD